MTTQDIDKGYKNAIISYITIFGTLIAFYSNNENKSEFAAFHLRQSLGLWLTFFLLGYIIGNFDNWYITIGFYVFFSILFIFGFSNAISKKATTVPLLGNLYQKLLANFAK